MQQGLAILRFVLSIAISLGVLVVAALGFFDALRRPEQAFSQEGKRSKKFWLLLLGAGLLVAVLGALQMGVGIILNLAALIPAAAYWYDVRPEIKSHGTTRGARPPKPAKPAKLPRKVEVPDYYDPADWDK